MARTKQTADERPEAAQAEVGRPQTGQPEQAPQAEVGVYGVSPQDEPEVAEGTAEPDRQNAVTEALIERRDRAVDEKARADAEGLPPDETERAAAAKAADPNAPSTAQVPDSSAGMVRVPDEGLPPERDQATPAAPAVIPGQPAGAVYPDRTT